MARLTRRAFILILGSSALFPATVGAQTDLWSGVLDPSRAVTWRNAGAGPIPSRPTCQTVPPYTGTAARINTAIAGCPSGQAVELAAGTFVLSDNIDISKNNVTLRGQGPLATKITWNADTGSTCGLDNGGAVCFNGGALGFGKCRDGNNGVCPDQTASWTAGYAKGATVITLDNVAGLAPGTQLFLDQLDDAADGWPLTGDLFVCAQGPGDPNPCSGEGGNSYGRDVSEGVGGRSQSQVVTVASVSGNQVTITPGLSMPNWRASPVRGVLPAGRRALRHAAGRLRAGHEDGGGAFDLRPPQGRTRPVRRGRGVVCDAAGQGSLSGGGATAATLGAPPSSCST